MKHSFLLFFLLVYANVLFSNDNVIIPIVNDDTDSVEVCDFFWYGLKDSVLRNTEIPFVKPQVSILDGNDLEQKTKAWQKDYALMSLVGDTMGSDSLALVVALDLFKNSVDLAMLTGEAKYVDVYERIIANALASASNINSNDKETKEVKSILKSVDNFIYARRGDSDLYINMYIRNDARIKMGNTNTHISVVCSAPWYNESLIRIDPETKQRFALHVRIPIWTRGDTLPLYDMDCKKQWYKIAVNGEYIPLKTDNGYLVIDRIWEKGDVVHLMFPSPIMRITQKGNNKMVALQRGPLVFSFEKVNDNGIDINKPIDAHFDKSKGYLILRSNNEEEYFEAIPYCKLKNRSKAQLFVSKK